MSITLKVSPANLRINTTDNSQTNSSKTMGHILPIPCANKKKSEINQFQGDQAHFLSETTSADIYSQDQGKVCKTANRCNSETEFHTASDRKMMDALKSVPDPSETVQERSTVFNWFYQLFFTSIGFHVAYGMAVGSVIGEKVLRLIFLIPAESIPKWLGVVNSCFNLGAVIGSLIGFQFSAKLGRVGTLFLAEGLTFFFHCLMLIFDGIWVLIVMRIGSGICSGTALCLVISLVNEQLPKKYIVQAGGCFSYFVTSGLIVLSLISFVTTSTDPNELDTKTKHWKCVLGIHMAFHGVRLALHYLLFKLDTPKFYVERMLESKDPQDVEKYSRLIRESLNQNYVEEDVSKIEEYLIATQKIKNIENPLTIANLFKKPYLRPLLSNIAIGSCGDLAGMNFFAWFAAEIFSGMGLDPTMALFLGTLLRYPGARIGVGSIQTFGIKSSLVFGTLIQSLGFYGLSFVVSSQIAWQAYIVLMIHRVGFTFTVMSTHVFAAKTLPPMGIGLTYSIVFSVSVFTSGIGPVVLHKNGPAITLMIFGTACLLAAMVLDIILGDDHGKTPTEIANEYDNFKYYRPLVSLQKLREFTKRSKTFENNYKSVKIWATCGVLPAAYLIYNLCNLKQTTQACVQF